MIIHKWPDKRNFIKIILRSEYNITTYELLNYINNLYNNYIKIYILERMASISLTDNNPQFYIYNESLLNKREKFAENVKNSEYILNKSECISCNFQDFSDKIEFFYIFREQWLPWVFCDSHSYNGILYNYFDEPSVFIKKISYNSPVELGISAVDAVELIIGEPRKKELHERKIKLTKLEEENLLLKNLIENLNLTEKVASISKLLNDPNIPPPVKNYIAYQLRHTIDQQTELNGRLGFKRVDTKA